MEKSRATPKKTRGPYPIRSRGEKIFSVVNIFILSLLGLACVLPFWYILCQSLSSNSAILAQKIGLLPVDFNLENYSYVIHRQPFWKSFAITLQRIGLGLPLNLFLIITSAYPLSKMKGKFKGRNIYVWFFFFTMLFNGGMIPTFLLVSKLGLLNKIWAMVLPQSINVFNMLLMLSFFRQIPSELEDAASVDGASHWRILWQIFVPMSTPVIATITLFSLVGHWNSWFDGMIYMNIERYPLQTYLRSIIINFRFDNLTPEEQKRLAEMNDKGLRSAQMIIGAIPILIVYPFLQKYFVSGITLGSIKG